MWCCNYDSMMMVLLVVVTVVRAVRLERILQEPLYQRLPFKMDGFGYHANRDLQYLVNMETREHEILARNGLGYRPCELPEGFYLIQRGGFYLNGYRTNLFYSTYRGNHEWYVQGSKHKGYELLSMTRSFWWSRKRKRNGFVGASIQCIGSNAACQDATAWTVHPRIVRSKEYAQRYTLWCHGDHHTFTFVYMQPVNSSAWIHVKPRDRCDHRYSTSTSRQVDFSTMPVDVFAFQFRGKKGTREPFGIQTLRHAIKQRCVQHFGIDDQLVTDRRGLLNHQIP